MPKTVIILVKEDSEKYTNEIDKTKWPNNNIIDSNIQKVNQN